MHIYTEFSHIVSAYSSCRQDSYSVKIGQAAEKITISILLRKTMKSCIVVLLRAEISFSQL